MLELEPSRQRKQESHERDERGHATDRTARHSASWVSCTPWQKVGTGSSERLGKEWKKAEVSSVSVLELVRVDAPKAPVQQIVVDIICRRQVPKGPSQRHPPFCPPALLPAFTSETFEAKAWPAARGQISLRQAAKRSGPRAHKISQASSGHRARPFARSRGSPAADPKVAPATQG